MSDFNERSGNFRRETESFVEDGDKDGSRFGVSISSGLMSGIHGEFEATLGEIMDAEIAVEFLDGDIKTLRHEVPMFTPTVQVVTVRKQVPDVEIEWREREVCVPKVEFDDREEIVEQIEYVTREEYVEQVVHVPQEVLVKVPKIEIQRVPRVCEVPAEKPTYVGKPYYCEAQFLVPRFVDRRVPIPVSCEIQPEIRTSNMTVEVDLCIHTPTLVPVNIYVPRLVRLPVIDLGIVNTRQVQMSEVDVKMLRQLTIEMNPHLVQARKFCIEQASMYKRCVFESQERAVTFGLQCPTPVMLHPVNDKGVEVDLEGDMDVFHAATQNFFAGMPGFRDIDAGQQMVYAFESKAMDSMRRSRASSSAPSRAGSAIESIMPACPPVA